MQNPNIKNIVLVGVVAIVAVCAWVSWGDRVVKNDVPKTDDSWKNEPIDETLGFPYGGGGQIGAEKENEVRNLFDGWMKEQKIQYDYLEYKINTIKMMVSKADPNIGVEKEWFPADSSDNAYIASVDFSVKAYTPQDYWFAGNGEVDQASGWVNNKFLLVTIDEVNGSYKIINIGTGP